MDFLHAPSDVFSVARKRRFISRGLQPVRFPMKIPCYLCLGIDVQCSNGRNEILFLFADEPEEFTIHAIFKFIRERSLNFPETEGPRNDPARSPSVRSPVDAVHPGFRSGRADPELLGPLPSGSPPAFPELPAVDLGHGFSTLPFFMECPMNTAHCADAAADRPLYTIGSSVHVQSISEIRSRQKLIPKQMVQPVTFSPKRYLPIRRTRVTKVSQAPASSSIPAPRELR